MSLLESIKERAKEANKTIILPESFDERNLRAAIECQKTGIANILLLGVRDELEEKSSEYGLDITGIRSINYKHIADMDMYIQKLIEFRSGKVKDKSTGTMRDMTVDEAKAVLEDELVFAAMLVKMKKADGYVSGAVHSTADTLRPALQIIKAAGGVSTVSAFFIMALPESSPYYKTQSVLFYADCGLVQNPTAEQLADIAIGTANSWRQLVGNVPPVVAMLSHSTKGSAKHPDIEKVIKATELVKAKAPELLVDGELQADSALIESIGIKKAPNSAVAGKANILVFPDLDAGNIAYKLTERLAGAAAIGPLISGLSQPVNDLSRGCSWTDIVDVVAVTVCQSI